MNSPSTIPLKILVAEDELILATAIAEELIEHGNEVIVPVSEVAEAPRS